MTTTINASTSAGLVQTADTSGVLALQTAGTTAVTIDASGNVGVGGTATANGGGYVTLGVNGTTAGIIEWKAGGVRQAQGYATTSQLALGTTTAIPFTFTTNNTEQMRITSAGNVTKPASSAFCAKLGNNTANVTGDGTLYTIVYDTKRFDYNSNYNTSTGVFTAPVTGVYQFNISSYLYVMSTGLTVEITLVTSNNSYQLVAQQGYTSYAQFPVGSIVADMDAADTAYVTVKVSGTTKTISLGQANNYFSGFLVG